MNVFIASFLSALIIITVILAIFGLFVLIKWMKWKSYSKYLQELEIFLSEEPYIDTLTVLRTIDIRLKEKEEKLKEQTTSSPNSQIEDNISKIENLTKNKEKFASQTITIEEKLKTIHLLKNSLHENIDKSRVFPCRKIIKKINFERDEINKVKQIVNKESLNFVNPFDEFWRIRYKYEKINNTIVTEIQRWISEVKNHNFEENINDKMHKIDQYLGEVESHLTSEKKNEALSSFTIYKKHLYDLLCFQNYYESFYNFLFFQSGQEIKKIDDHIEKIKQGTSINFEILNISEYRRNVQELLLNAQNSFYNLDVKSTNEYIKDYKTKAFDMIRLISQEVYAYNFINVNKNIQIDQYWDLINDKYNELKQSCEKVIHIDKIFYWGLESNLNEITELKNEISSNITNLSNIVFDNDVLYMTKQSQYKKIFLLMRKFFDLYNDIDKDIDSFYSAGFSLGLKYKRLKNIYIFGLSDIKKFNIKLTKEDKEIIDLIEKKKQEIDSNLFNKNSGLDEKTLKEDIHELYEATIKFANEVLKKVVIYKAFILINIEFSHLRNENYSGFKSYNEKVLKSESLLDSGQYIEALKYLSKSVKNVIEVNKHGYVS